MNILQLVWHSSTKLGIGMATRADERYGTFAVVVARYDPSGNWRGRYLENVRRNETVPDPRENSDSEDEAKSEEIQAEAVDEDNLFEHEPGTEVKSTVVKRGGFTFLKMED